MASAPLSMAMLDSLSSHCKMTLIQTIMNQVITHSKSNQHLTPALVETYSRLLVYTELESLGIKGFISKYDSIADKILIIRSSLRGAYQPFSVRETHGAKRSDS